MFKTNYERIASTLENLTLDQLEQVYQIAKQRIVCREHEQKNALITEEWNRLKPIIIEKAKELMERNPDTNMGVMSALGIACSQQKFEHVQIVTMSMLMEEGS